MRKANLKYIAVLMTLICFISPWCVSAEADKSTYTYSYEGKIQISPAAYTPIYEISEFGAAGTLDSPEDIFYDSSNSRIIIADTGNDRIVILDTAFNVIKVISEFDSDDKLSDSFKSPQGVFVAADSMLYVADTNNSRIVVFDSEYNFSRILPPLSAKVLPENFQYNPKAVAVDRVGRIYVVSKNTNMGVIALDIDGSFEGFIGAQKVSANAVEMIKKVFMTEAQLQRTTNFVPVEYSNLTVDEKGFIYVTSSQIDRYSLYNAVNSRSTADDYAPIKKINPAGTDVLKRNGFFPPVGDVIFDAYDGTDAVEPSQITEVSLLENGMYALLDSCGNKIFVYDENGNLLYAFGGEGARTGFYTALAGMAFNREKLYTLDMKDATVTVSEKTEYGELIDKVIGYQKRREYDKANDLFKELLEKNNNLDMAYLGLGKICLEEKDYTQAMYYFKLINNKKYWEKAFALERKQVLNKYGMVFLLVALILIFVLIGILKRISKFNDRKNENRATGKLSHQLLYGFYLITHPFKGYCGIRFEKRGSALAATVWLVIGSVGAIFSSLCACYLQKDSSASIMSALSNTLFPLLLWCVSNICFTTLMNGKGRFKDVYTAVGYASIPYSLLMIPGTFFSYAMTSDELSILNLVSTFAIVWVVFLIFSGMMTIHDYSFGKNLVVSVLTVFGMVFILFLLLVFMNLTGKMISLVSNIVSELVYRM